MNRNLKISKFALLFSLLIFLAACASGPVAPKAGHWEGSDPDVSFNITADGTLTNFSMQAPYGASDCNITIASLKMPEAGTLLIDLTSTESLSTGYIQGDFSAEKISGKFKIDMCNMNISLMPDDAKDRDWSAEWKNP
jgi:hypothetical protein